MIICVNSKALDFQFSVIYIYLQTWDFKNLVLCRSKVASAIRLLQNQTQNASKTVTVSRDNPKGSASK